MRFDYIVINSEVLPEVYTKVLEAKELIRTNRVKDVTEAVKAVGISRSTFYKYRDHVFALKEGMKGQKATISIVIIDKAGTLSDILDNIAKHGGNIYTINQDIPINGAAYINITLDIAKLDIEIKELIDILSTLNNIIRVDLVAIE
ncbi:ACT domain-containing protein [Clostridium sp. 19966]|uniref:ACT domain-containing protein n=1 Tax=Clostridium sp. 19966 TaxID=2768166 RepID=UPI0028DFFB69|nr:ACT domain-containing protein [Clostridium sp. 19966]MDT8718740.1 ACT domain-containing protein [Clostridium sp. 19966]